MSIEQQLKAPFPERDIEWRVARAGKSSNGEYAQVIAYVTARAIQDRLDEVVKPENWQNTVLITERGVISTISIRVGDEWISRSDGADYTDFEAFKGGISGALKRAGALWGIGRYLYDLEATYVGPVKNGKYRAEYKDGDTKRKFYWNPPPLPNWALPINDGGKPAPNVLREAKLTTQALLDNADTQAYLKPAEVSMYAVDIESGLSIERERELYAEILKLIKHRKAEEKKAEQAAEKAFKKDEKSLMDEVRAKAAGTPEPDDSNIPAGGEREYNPASDKQKDIF